MLKARSSFPSIIYENIDESEQKVRVADIMTRYFSRIDEIFQIEPTEQNEVIRRSSDSSGILKPEVPGNMPQLDIKKYQYNIEESRRKVKKISTTFSKIDDDMKKLEDDGQLLSVLRENLDGLGRNFWDWLQKKDPVEISMPVTSNSG